MINFDLPTIIAIALVFVLAGFVKGVTGMGLPTVAMGLLGTTMAPVSAASLLVGPSLLTNVLQLFWGPSIVRQIRRHWGMMVGIFCGTIFSTHLIAHDSRGFASVGLGIALMLYSVAGLSALRIRIAPSVEPWLSPAIGLVTGVTTGMTGVFVFPSVPYLQSLNLDRDDLIQALGLSFTVSTIGLMLGLVGNATFDHSTIWASGLAIVPAFAGMGVGQWLRQKISQQAFRTWFFIGLLCLSCDIISTWLIHRL
ncbi:MAG: sulfite exporter TauE/SafE family protein [Aliidongia sp.]